MHSAYERPFFKIKKKPYFLHIPWAFQKQSIWRWFWSWAVWPDPWAWTKATSLKARSIALDKFLPCHSLLANIFGSFLHCFLEAARRWVGCKSASCDAAARQRCGGFQCERALVKQADPWGPTKQVGVLSFWSSFTTCFFSTVKRQTFLCFCKIQYTVCLFANSIK